MANPFNLYNPVDPGNDLWDVAFSAHAYHSQEVEDTIEMIASGATALELYDNFSDSDLEYIEQQLYERYGIHADLTLSD